MGEQALARFPFNLPSIPAPLEGEEPAPELVEGLGWGA